MEKQELIVMVNEIEDEHLTLEDLCEVCSIPANVALDFITYEIIHPSRSDQHEQFFSVNELQRVKAALRIQHDLEVNLAGVALILDLLDELQTLRDRASLLERHLLK
jgi:chaperone modulatory protein CbpM